MNLVFQNFGRVAQFSVPYLLLIVMFTLDNIYLPWQSFGDIRPNFVLMAVFYWAIYRPALLPPLFIFCLALAMDTTRGTALGLHCLIYLPAFLFIRAQRRLFYDQPFYVVWLGFLAAAIGVNGLTFILQRLSLGQFALAGQEQLLMSVFYNIAGGVFLFPLVAFLLYLVHRILPMPSRKHGEIK